MTEQLTQAAQQDIGVLQHYIQGGTECRKPTEAEIASLRLPLTQRPAAQAGEREAFEAEMRCEETWGHRSLKKRPDGRYQNWQVDVMWDVWQARASLPNQPAAQATPEPVALIREVATRIKAANPGDAFFTLQVLDELVKKLIVRAPATPEPVGEPFGYFRALPFGWEQCSEHDDGAIALYDRPAPGVPEGFALVPVEPTREMNRAGFDAHHATGLTGEIWRAMLAAAQAKGGE